MSEFKSSNFRNEDGSGGPDIVGLTTFTSPYYFVPPSGTTAERPSNPAPGMLRFNEDIGRLEVWRNDHWATILGESPNLGNQLVTNSAGGTGPRGLLAGGYSPAPGTLVDRIDYITISTLGNAQDFSNLVAATRLAGGCASSTRGLFGGGASPAPTKTTKIDYVTISSTGNAQDFGDLTLERNQLGACSNQTRGIWGGGDGPGVAPSIVNVIDYVTIASTGNAVDFGNLIANVEQLSACSSSVRGVFGAGTVPSFSDVIQYITISTTGDAQDFGDLATARNNAGCCSNPIRGVWSGGAQSPGAADLTSIEFITIASTGNAQDFGDLTTATRALSACSSSIRGIFNGGQSGASPLDTIEYITIPTTGNAQDFGDLQAPTTQNFSCSNGHGGL